jgi:hypothetical protein
MRRTVLLLSFVVVCLSAVEVAADQSLSAAGPISLSVLGGASAGSGNAGAAVGATLAVAVSNRVSLEGRGVFLDRGPGSSALDLNASLLVTDVAFAEELEKRSDADHIFKALATIWANRVPKS